MLIITDIYIVVSRCLRKKDDRSIEAARILMEDLPEIA